MKKILFSLLMLCCMTAAWAQPWPPAVYEVGTLERLKEVISHRMADDKCIAEIKLTADIYMSDLGEGESGRHTLCSTFSGTLDGNGHTIWAARPEVTHNSTGHYHRQYLFTYSDGATFKNLTFKNFRVQSVDHHNQAIITSQAKNGCVFDNITFDHISTYVGDGHDNTGAAAGYATTNCTFKNITVKNSDFTADRNQAGTVVGHAMNCSFENIKVEHCESTSRGEKSGGVAGRTDDCTINNVEILNSFIKNSGKHGGGVTGFSVNSQYRNCTIDDQSCICTQGASYTTQHHTFYRGDAGGIVGYSESDNIYDCINSALIASNGRGAGGIVGYSLGSTIDGCLNTGMIISMRIADVKDWFYNNYKTKTDMTFVTKIYQGKEYVIRNYDGADSHQAFFGGIVGEILKGSKEGKVSKCVNFGSVLTESSIHPTTYDVTCGGIAGGFPYENGGSIIDCLSDFTGRSVVKGICGEVNEGTSIDNCLNMTTYKDFAAKGNEWGDFKGEHNYSLTTAEDAHHTTKTTAAKIESGEICALLGANWEQNIGIDAYPSPTGSKKGIYHTRTVSNQYGTVCLPFALKSDDAIRYYTFNESSDANGETKLNFDYAETVAPGTPVLFKVAETGDVTFSGGGEGWAASPVAPASATWNFTGTYEECIFEGDAAKTIYYVSGGKIKHGTKATIAPYRAYFSGPSIDELTSNASAPARVRIVIDGEEGETSALEFVYDYENHNDNRSYTLFGTEAGEGYRGIVIRGGKKVIVNN